MTGFGQKVVNQAQKSARQTAVSIAKKVAQERLETTQSVNRNLGLPESAPKSPDNSFAEPVAAESSAVAYDQIKAQSDAQSRQILQKLEAEIEKIRQEKKQKELMQNQQEEQTKVQTAQVEEKKKETMMQKVGKIIKGRIAGKREMKQGPSG